MSKNQSKKKKKNCQLGVVTTKIENQRIFFEARYFDES